MAHLSSAGLRPRRGRRGAGRGADRAAAHRRRTGSRGCGSVVAGGRAQHLPNAPACHTGDARPGRPGPPAPSRSRAGAPGAAHRAARDAWLDLGRDGGTAAAATADADAAALQRHHLLPGDRRCLRGTGRHTPGGLPRAAVVSGLPRFSSPRALPGPSGRRPGPGPGCPGATSPRGPVPTRTRTRARPGRGGAGRGRRGG